MDPRSSRVIVGMFAGPETIAEGLLDPGLLDRIRAA